MKKTGIPYIRYVDDTRVFGKTEADTRRALVNGEKADTVKFAWPKDSTTVSGLGGFIGNSALARASGALHPKDLIFTMTTSPSVSRA